LQEDKKLLGCMIGRVCYDNPWLLADVDRVFYKQKNLGHSRREILEVKEFLEERNNNKK